MKVEPLSPTQLAALSDDELLDFIEACTDTVESAPVAREARLLAWDEARENRQPPIAFAKLADRSRMSTSGVINARRARMEKDHAAGKHKRKAVAECHPCREAVAAK